MHRQSYRGSTKKVTSRHVCASPGGHATTRITFLSDGSSVHTLTSHGWPQVDELKQHIKILQAVGYNALEGEDVSSPGDGRGDTAGAGPQDTSQRSLEALLLAKNRHLEHELTMARLQVADLTGVNAFVMMFG